MFFSFAIVQTFPQEINIGRPNDKKHEISQVIISFVLWNTNLLGAVYMVEGGSF